MSANIQVRCEFCDEPFLTYASFLAAGRGRHCSRRCASRHAWRDRREKFRARDVAQTKHGRARTPEYRAWVSAKARCYNPRDKDYARYGGRGIAMCARWRQDFSAFLDDVGPRPSPQHSVDRWPNGDGDYEPGNVRWATAGEQARNREFTPRWREQLAAARHSR